MRFGRRRNVLRLQHFYLTGPGSDSGGLSNGKRNRGTEGRTRNVPRRDLLLQESVVAPLDRFRRPPRGRRHDLVREPASSDRIAERL